MLILKQSTSVTVQFGPFVDNTDGVPLEVGLASAMDNATTGIRLAKNGGTLADRNDSTVPAYDAMGFYKIVLDATDTNALGTLLMTFEEAATTLPVWAEFMVMPAAAYDGLFASAPFATVAALASAQTDLDTLTDARTEPAQGAPPVSATTNVKVDWIYKTLRNKKDGTATLQRIYNDDTTTVDYKRTVSDDGTIYVEEEIVTGP